MKMFGVIPYKRDGTNDNDYIKAGWNANATAAQRIISLDASVDGTPVNDPNIPGVQISKRALFEREFRKIASTSVGRVLLYRILIEIRRHSESNIGIFEYTSQENNAFINERNIVRSIIIQYSDKIAFYKAHRSISFIAQKTNASIIKINNALNARYDCISFDQEYSSDLDVNIFHELGHWFHFLRDSCRFISEGSDKKLFDHFLGRYLWNNLEGTQNEERKFWSSFCWHQWNADGDIVDFEEMRNIIGSSRSIDESFKEGDDISENLYRSCCGHPLRFGHESLQSMGGDFYEDKRVISKVISLNTVYAMKYPIDCTVDNIVYANCAKCGLGSFKSLPNDEQNEQQTVGQVADKKCILLTID